MSKIFNQAFTTSIVPASHTPQKSIESKSNILSIEYLTDSFQKSRSCSQNKAYPDTAVTFYIQLTNSSDITLHNIRAKDFLDENLDFIPNSLTIDNTPHPHTNPTQEYTITDALPPKKTLKIAYNTLINPLTTENTAKSTTQITYSANNTTNITEFSNETTIHIIQSSPHITIEKSANKTTANSGEIITCINKISTSNTVNASITFLDNLPPNVQFVSKSVYINNKNAPNLDPQQGFILSDLPPNSTTIIEYKIKVF